MARTSAFATLIALYADLR